MPLEYSYTDARDHLADLMNRAVSEHEVLTIKRRLGGGEFQEVVLMDASDLAGLLETLHLLSSPRNAERLFSALEGSKAGTGTVFNVADLRKDLTLLGVGVAGGVQASTAADEADTGTSSDSVARAE